jgi:hypothetical protein
MADRKDLQVRPFNEAGFNTAMERIAKSRGITVPANQAEDDLHELLKEQDDVSRTFRRGSD